MAVKIERFSVFYLEVDKDRKQIVCRVDDRNIRLMSKDRLKANFQDALQRLQDYQRGGFAIDGEDLLRALGMGN